MAGLPIRWGCAPVRLLLLLCIGLCPANAQYGDSVSPYANEVTGITTDSLPASSTDSIVPWRLALVGGAAAGGFVVGHVILNDLWWKGERRSFWWNYQRDWDYALGADKLGHAFGTYSGTDLLRRSLLWSGVDSATALALGVGGALFYTTYIEVRDGFSKEWGFSLADFGANLAGAAWRIAEQETDWMQQIAFKISFWPSERFRAGSHRAIFDDYESSYHWLSLDVKSLTGAKWWPDMFDLAVGHSVQGLDNLEIARHELYLALDWDLTALPGRGHLFEFLKQTANYYHLPAPAIRITPGVIWLGLR